MGLSGLANQYLASFREVGPVPGFTPAAPIGAKVLSELPLATAAVVSPLAQQGLGELGGIGRQKLSDAAAKERLQMSNDLQREGWDRQERIDAKLRKRTLADRLLSFAAGAGGSGRTSAQDWALGQLMQPGYGMRTGLDNWGVGQAGFTGGLTLNDAQNNAYMEVLKAASNAGSTIRFQ
jgi:hypothetical protein